MLMSCASRRGEHIFAVPCTPAKNPPWCIMQATVEWLLIFPLPEEASLGRGTRDFAGSSWGAQATGAKRPKTETKLEKSQSQQRSANNETMSGPIQVSVNA
ncbi:hypothetical protein BABINDRAFT_91067 [Babjeviella inositovora NRRL Y-12698]|uniref:Uncharacterized protein n=1 Tax=Babjeviella inositovora NRRL Y-12698 TaxID=984486 RepID=A0A1E3QK34_9ASCO|nr:uncharacterized protein BABINDRAFT_91067 [Babjeviella inositovora NRRL Y-12698]ODQ77978.1 hypothetical protein BABINDRAFT_91067 [Babjeviella inositovora NRRL Y-12698]